MQALEVHTAPEAISMQNRQFPRTEYSIPVVLYYAPLGLVRGTSTDISRCGMRIDTGIVSLAPNAEVNICFVYNTTENRQVFRFNGQVMHNSDTGTGLQFNDINLVLPGIP